MESKLFLETVFSHGKTEIKDIYFTSPYKVMSPFVEGAHMELVQMSASAGMLSGDQFTLDMVFREHSDVTYLSQSYEKVFASKGEQTVKRMHMTVEEGARVCYMPYPMIPFAGSDFLGENQIHILKNASLLYCDIFSCGRVGMGEFFQMKCYRSRTKIWIENELVFADHTLLDPVHFCYQTMGMWDRYTHNGMLYFYVPNEKKEKQMVDWIRSQDQNGLLAGCTKCRKGVAVRVLGTRGDEIYEFFREIALLFSGSEG